MHCVVNYLQVWACFVVGVDYVMRAGWGYMQVPERKASLHEQCVDNGQCVLERVHHDYKWLAVGGRLRGIKLCINAHVLSLVVHVLSLVQAMRRPCKDLKALYILCGHVWSPMCVKCSGWELSICVTGARISPRQK